MIIAKKTFFLEFRAAAQRLYGRMGKKILESKKSTEQEKP